MTKKKILAQKKTLFNDIYITHDRSIREMWFKGRRDFFLQTRLDLKRPDTIPMVYPQLMLAALLIKPHPRRVLMIGLGGGHLARQMLRLFPETHLDIIEIDPEVVNFAKRYFLFKESCNCKCFIMDGRVFIKKQQKRAAYDIVWLDAFKSGSVPYHLKTQQFYEEIQCILTPGGVVGSNLYGKSNDLMPHDLKTFKQVFKYIYSFQDLEHIATSLLSTDLEPRISAEEFIASAKKLDKQYPFSSPLETVATLYQDDLLREKVAFVFKDKFSPLEFMENVKRNNLDNNKTTRIYSIASSSFHEKED